MVSQVSDYYSGSKIYPIKYKPQKHNIYKIQIVRRNSINL